MDADIHATSFCTSPCNDERAICIRICDFDLACLHYASRELRQKARALEANRKQAVEQSSLQDRTVLYGIHPRFYH